MSDMLIKTSRGRTPREFPPCSILILSLPTDLDLQHRAHVLQQRLVLAVYKAALLPAGEQSLVCILDELVRQRFILAGPDPGGFIRQRLFALVGHHLTVFIPKILTDDDPAIIKLQSLRRMNAPDLFMLKSDKNIKNVFIAAAAA